MKSRKARRGTVNTALQGQRLVMTRGYLAQRLDVATRFPQNQHEGSSRHRAHQASLLPPPRQPQRKRMVLYLRKHQQRNGLLLHPKLDDPQPRPRLKTVI
uniref:Uncharacterized protein n=1 Tax=Brassica oleracea TaxID=3712 RepID=A0A3P6GGC9_BRAOL|nr:unnamed protein product [Brassica oleracea]